MIIKRRHTRFSGNKTFRMRTLNHFSTCRHFMQADANKFHDVWCMNEAELKDLVLSVLEADTIIHSQQMGLEWNQPEMYVYMCMC